MILALQLITTLMFSLSFGFAYRASMIILFELLSFETRRQAARDGIQESSAAELPLAASSVRRARVDSSACFRLSLLSFIVDTSAGRYLLPFT